MEDEHEPPLQPRTQTQGRILFLTVCAAGIGGTFQFGYNLSIINAPTLHVQEFINETWLARTGRPLPDHLVLLVWSLIVSLYPLGGLFGALLAGPLAITLGRKKSLLVNNVFVVASAVLFGFSREAGSFEMILLGRLLVGVSAGVSMNVQPMYLGESAPQELRGAVAMTSAIFTALGIMLGQVVGIREFLGGPQAWPLLLASCLVPGVLQLSTLPLLPESPRYLLIDRGDAEACLAALRRLRGTQDVAAEMREMEEERAACRGRCARRPWELFQDRALRRQVMSLVVLGSAMELCGNDSVYAYAASVFREAGVPEEKIQYAIIGTGSCELLTAFVSTSVPWVPYLAMSCIFAFILSFGIGPGGLVPLPLCAFPWRLCLRGRLHWLVPPRDQRQDLPGDLRGTAQTQFPQAGPRPCMEGPRGHPVHRALAARPPLPAPDFLPRALAPGASRWRSCYVAGLLHGQSHGLKLTRDMWSQEKGLRHGHHLQG